MNGDGNGDTSQMNGCLGDNDLMACVEGAKTPAIEGHLAACTACRRKVVRLATSIAPADERSGMTAEMRRLVHRSLPGRSFPWIPIVAAAAAVLVAVVVAISMNSQTPDNRIVDVPKPKPKVEPKPEPKTEPVPEPKPEPKPEPRPEPKPEPIPEPKPEPKPEPRPEPKPEPIPEPEPKPEPKPEPRPEPKPEPEPAEITKAATHRGLIEVTAGIVKVQHKGSKDWQVTGARSELDEGDRLKIDGGARLLLPDGSSLCASTGAELVLDRIDLIPHRLALVAGELFAETRERLHVKAASLDVSGEGTLHFKARGDEGTVSVFSGGAKAAKVALEAGSQLSMKGKAAGEPKKIGTTQLASWIDPLRSVLFMDEFQGASLEAAWDAHGGAAAKIWSIKPDAGSLLSRLQGEKGEFRAFMLWTRHGVDIEAATSFEVQFVTNRADGITPRVDLARFQGDRTAWRIVYSCVEGKEAVFMANDGKEGKDREKVLWRGGAARAQAKRTLQLILDPKELIVVLDGTARYRGAHELKDLEGVVFGVGQEGKADPKGGEARFDRVRIAPVKK